MIRTVIFDVDDTLYDFSAANQCAMGALYAYAKIQLGWDRETFLQSQKAAMEDIKRYAGTSGGYRTRLIRYQNMLEAAGLPIYPHAMQMSEIYRDTLLGAMVPAEGAADFLRYLKEQGLRIGIASDATAMQQFTKLARLNLLQYVDFMVTSEEAGVEKPASRFFERCGEKIHCLPEEVLFIGDNPEKDITGADLAGYHAIWYNPHRKASSRPMMEIHHFSEGPALLTKLNPSETGNDIL